MKTKVKIPAKVNLTLDITGVSGGYHTLRSLCATVSVYEKVSLTKRKDKQLTLKFTGLPVSVKAEESNAYKVAKAFTEKYNTFGADIVIKRNIVDGGGLGGSSADTVGVIKGLSKLYGIKDDFTQLLTAYGSDTVYMYHGGYKVITGRGNDLQGVKSKMPLYFIILTEEKGVSTEKCYKGYDEIGKVYDGTTDNAVKSLECGDEKGLKSFMKNDLYESAIRLNPKIEENINALEKYTKAVMTGSGSTVYGIFKNKKERNFVYKRLRVKGFKPIKCKSVN